METYDPAGRPLLGYDASPHVEAVVSDVSTMFMVLLSIIAWELSLGFILFFEPVVLNGEVRICLHIFMFLLILEFIAWIYSEGCSTKHVRQPFGPLFRTFSCIGILRDITHLLFLLLILPLFNLTKLCPFCFSSKYTRLEMVNLEVWEDLKEEWDYFMQTRGLYLGRIIRRGIPHEHRPWAWARLLGLDRWNQTPGYYLALLSQSLPQETSETLQGDLMRIVPDHLNKEAIRKPLKNVLHALALHDSECGYVQGMGCLVAFLLQYFSEEDTFYGMLALFRDERYSMRRLFADVKLEKLFIRFGQFDWILNRICPKIAKKLNKFNIQSYLYAQNWLQTIFVHPYVPENDTITAHLWDVFLSEGYVAVYLGGLGLLKAKRERILEASTRSEALTIIQEPLFPSTFLDEFLKIRLTMKEYSELSS